MLVKLLTWKNYQTVVKPLIVHVSERATRGGMEMCILLLLLLCTLWSVGNTVVYFGEKHATS